MHVKRAMWMLFAVVLVILVFVLAQMYLNSGYTDPAEFVDQKYQE